MTYVDQSGQKHTVTEDVTGTSTTFKYLNFDTSYTFEVKTRFLRGDFGKGISIVKKTDPFSASLGPLRKRVISNTVMLSWSAPRTIDKTTLKV